MGIFIVREFFIAAACEPLQPTALLRRNCQTAPTSVMREVFFAMEEPNFFHHLVDKKYSACCLVPPAAKSMPEMVDWECLP
jgi:hypothetical protein